MDLIDFDAWKMVEEIDQALEEHSNNVQQVLEWMRELALAVEAIRVEYAPPEPDYRDL